MSNPVYCRFPDIHDDDVVFVADDDVWLVPATGGRAQRLTSDHVPCVNPCFSPDGTRIAWASTINGEPDVYMLSRASGVVTRLTWFGSTATVAGWIDDAHVAVASGHAEVFPGLRRLYSVALDGTWQKLPLGPAMGGAWARDGRLAINTPNNRESSYWKRYRGGTASALWVADHPVSFAATPPREGNQWIEILPGEPAGKYAPGWVGDRLIFTSDLGAGQARITEANAQAQLYSVLPNGTDLRQHTHHAMAQGYVRDARTDGRRVVYHARGVIYLMDALDADPKPITIDLGINVPRADDLEVERIDNLSVDATGTGSLIEWHGAAFYLTHRAGPARLLTDGRSTTGAATRVREPAVLGTTGMGVVVTEAEGDDALEVFPLDGLGDHRLLVGGLGRVLDLASAPDGSKVAVATHDGRVLVVTIAAGAVTTVGEVADDYASGLVWSPDGRYLAWSEEMGRAGNDSARLCYADINATDRVVFALTSGTYVDTEPVFTPDGKYIAWLSRRNYDPLDDDFGFQLSFRAATRVVVAPLSATEVLPFGVSADGWALGKDDKDEDKAALTCQLDPEGLEARSVVLPVPAGRYMDLVAVAGGLAWLAAPDKGGELGSTWAGAPGEMPSPSLKRFAFATRKAETLCAAADAIAVSGDGTQLVVAHKGELTVIPADRKLDDDDDARVKVDLTRLRRSVDKRAQWHQMLAEAWRLMAQHYWRADLNGLDWPAVLASYQPVVETAMTDSDVYDILYECQAESNTSHSYVTPKVPDPSPTATGYLGVEARQVDDGFEITRILPGEAGDPNAWAPMLAAGVGARAGDVIVAIDGRDAAGVLALGALLQGAAGKTVEVTLRRGDEPRRRVAVVALRSEAALRYQDWVARRAAHVEQVSGGRLGYVHVPDMMHVGWAQLERRLDKASRHEGVLADMRYNRGGYVSELVINRLTQKVLGWTWPATTPPPRPTRCRACAALSWCWPTSGPAPMATSSQRRPNFTTCPWWACAHGAG